MSTALSFVLAAITGFIVHACHGPVWAVEGFGMTVLNVALVGDRVVAAIRRNRAPSGSAK